MRRARSWCSPADFAVVSGDAALLPQALARVERALANFPPESPQCIGYATQDHEPKLHCGVEDQKGGAAVRLYGVVDNGSYDTVADDTIVAVRGVRGDRYRGLVGRADTPSTLKLCLEAAAVHLRSAAERPATLRQVEILAKRARAIAAMGCGRRHDEKPRLRGSLSTPWGSAASIPMVFSSGSDQMAHNLLDPRERADQDDLTAVLVTLGHHKANPLKDHRKPRDRTILHVTVSAFWSEIENPDALEMTSLMRLAQSLKATPE